MAAKITLTVEQDPFLEPEFIFTKPTRCVIGRADDCAIRVPTDIGHVDISRHHCLLDINPPGVRIRDLGSRNGTFVNGEKIGQRPARPLPETTDLNLPGERVLGEGDEIRVGHVVFRVGVQIPRDR
jgi:pSer/pThr/pTyr-binding forkhead associated (FHA) protein